jgi:hypothetical protein
MRAENKGQRTYIDGLSALRCTLPMVFGLRKSH